MTRVASILLGILVLLAAEPAAAQAAGSRVTGSVADGDAHWAPGDVWVQGDEFELQAWVIERPLDAGAIFADGRIDDADFAAARAAGNRMLWLGFDAAGAYSTGALLSDRSGRFVRVVRGSGIEPAMSARIEDGRWIAALELPGISLRVDTLIMGGDLAAGPRVQDDGIAFRALVAQLQAAADPGDEDWIERLHPDLRQRWQGLLAANGSRAVDFARDGRSLLPRTLAALRGIRRAGDGDIELQGNDEHGRHWAGTLAPHDGQWRLRALALQPDPPPFDRARPLTQGPPGRNADGVHRLTRGIERGIVGLVVAFTLILLLTATPWIFVTRRRRREAS